MYRPPKYIKEDLDFIQDFIRKFPFATMVSKRDEFIATHIPVLAEGEKENFRLYGHIANHNKQLAQIKEGAKALLIFQGNHGYVSSSWYAEKDISTWDYSAVHIHAEIELQSREELIASLEKLVHAFEKEQENPLYYKDIPKKMLEDHIDLITGFWLKPTKIEGVAKLHQTYSEENKRRTIAKLSENDDAMDAKLSEDIRRENNL